MKILEILLMIQLLSQPIMEQSMAPAGPMENIIQL